MQNAEKAAGEKTVGDKGEAAVNTSDTYRVQKLLFDHGRLLY
jgi:hypothetical protein